MCVFNEHCQLLLVMLSLTPVSAWADAETTDGTTEEEFEQSVFCFTPVLDRSCVAVRIPVTDEEAVSGISWFNNDAATVFPKVMIASGAADVPPLYADGVVVGENVSGVESDWSDLTFSANVASDTGTLYVIFQLPVEGELIDVGDGPGIGYLETEEPSCVFVSSDGDEWSRMVTTYALMVEPVMIERTADMLALKSSNGLIMGEANEPQETPEVIDRTELLMPYPNPFNPVTNIGFTLKKASNVNLAIYDLRGRMVQQLRHGHMDVGRYENQWYGTDNSGGRVASGVYFARLIVDNSSMIHRVMLVK